MISGGLQALNSIIAFGTGFLIGATGAFNIPKQGIFEAIKTYHFDIRGLALSPNFRKFLGGIILKGSLYWPFSSFLRRLQKNYT